MNLKSARLKAKFTQSEVAKLLGVRQSTVSMWETGEISPRADKLVKLAMLYQCTIDELLKERKGNSP